jgi:hypothetical protein
MSWQEEIINFCNHYNIPVEYLANTLNEPKVIPMIRGKAFEFSVLKKRQGILSTKNWKVEKNLLNAQLGMHDEDVAVIYLVNEQRFGVECKLAGKGRFKKLQNGDYVINVKCMRSRTLGTQVATRLAPQLGVSVEMLSNHNDQYRVKDFDFVVTSIGNAFYETDDDGLFYWSPDKDGIEFCKKMFDTSDEALLQKLAFEKMYITSAHNLAVGNGFNICTKKKCTNQSNCGFIPNYPPINFDCQTLASTNGWVAIEESEDFILNHIRKKV